MIGLVSRGVKKLVNDGVSETLIAAGNHLEIPQIIKLGLLAQGKLISYHDNKYMIKSINGKNKIFFPHFSDWSRTRTEYREKLNEYYFNNKILNIEKGDIVFDVGAYIGVTSIIASETAKMVYAIEPSPRARKCLEYNTRDYDNIKVLPYAVWDKSEKIELEYGLESSEDALITPDDGGSGQKVMVQAHTIEYIAGITNIDQIDFLKIEAEGVEPEIVGGIGDTPVKKVSSSGNAERNGETTHQEVSNKLEKMGYEVTEKPSHPYGMVYAKYAPE
jgi:FkbM family methyltransferase